MKKFLILFMLISLPLISYAKDYTLIDIDIKPKEGVIRGTIKVDGDSRSFRHILKNSFFSNGHTYVLYGDWMPRIPSGWGAKVRVNLPDGFMLVDGADSYSDGVYTYENPDKELPIAFSDLWNKKSIKHNGITLSVYFTDHNKRYQDKYLAKLQTLVDYYTKKLGDYPFGSFSVVDVPYPAGHALTAMTFVSGRIIGMPFMLETSLGHELVHQWIGVAVRVDADAGNWSEGLTTYLADMHFAEEEGDGAEYRKNSLLAYMAHARQKEGGTCLMHFQYNKDKSAQAVGYGKGAMFFQMLADRLGEDKFDTGLRAFIANNKYKKVDWSAITSELEKVSGKDLSEYTDGWLVETALADFSITDIKQSKTLDGYSLAFDLVNKYEWLEYPLEIVIHTADGENRKLEYVKGAKQKIEIRTKNPPEKLVIDPEYKTARFLTDREVYPTLHGLFSKYDKVIFVKDADREKYKSFINSLENADVVSVSENPYKHLSSVMVFLGDDNHAFQKLYGQAESGGKLHLKAYLNPLYAEKSAYLLTAEKANDVSASMRRITHYGKYSELLLGNDGRFITGLADAERGVVIDLKRDTGGVKVDNHRSVADIINENKSKNIFIVGEDHDNYAHHDNQLRLIKELVRSGRKVAIGLEMFQRPFQNHLDEYIAGRMTQADMLYNTEYYDRWRFDFRLYKEIFDYAQEHKIPLVALNIEQEITKKVSKGGLDALSNEDAEKLPSEIDYSNKDYRDFLMNIFAMHEGRSNFDYFYQAQLLWDETMAETAAEYLKAHNDALVVIVGNGHVRHRYGIPDRLSRRIGKDVVSIVQGEDYEEGIADYILYPDEMDYENSPKIGVMVDETDEGLKVVKVMDNSIAMKAGLKDGDYITSFNGRNIRDLADIRIAMLYADKGGEYKVSVRRPDGDFTFTVSF